MPSDNERKALGFLVLIALSGGAVRLWQQNSAEHHSASIESLQRQIGRSDSARAVGAKAKGRDRKPTRSSGPTNAIDLDRATAAEIEALPGIGPALAARIVAHRDSVGSFGGMDAFCEVRGIGKATAERLRPLVTFTAPQRPVSATCGEASQSSRKSRKATTSKRR